MFVLDASNEQIIEELKLTKKSGAVFGFEYYSQIDKKLIIEPRISGEANILFYP